MDRAALLSDVSRKLGRRRLVWAGIRGEDAVPLADLPQFDGAFSFMSRYSQRTIENAVAYEDLTGVREDPDAWDIDDHTDEQATKDFRRALLSALSGDSALMTYRPSRFFSAIAFARQDRCRTLGMFGAHQFAFEHKPWVETAVAELGLPHIPWTYVADEDQLSTKELLTSGSMVLRRSRTSGGAGIVRIDDPAELRGSWPVVDEGFVSVAPYFENALPVNVGATVWRDGGVTVHRPSAQLIGIPQAVARPFGYAGNDFGLMRDVDPRIVDEIEDSTRRIGAWLGRNGYLGTFGVDYLIHDGHALFTEINPRFQGSTHASCRLSIEAGEACLMLEHLAAWLDVPRPTEARPLRDVVAETPDLAHLVVHWEDDAAELDCDPLLAAIDRLDPHGRTELVPPSGIVNARGAQIVRWTTRRRVTDDGYSLLPAVREVGSDLLEPIHEGALR
ncbi:ATP-grasp domain-containing protein [Rathayibacter sp. Leaf296]|uniref:ATP-grasp domain-containing protein n=1 Tax=Rathayibacter sp. Leaf296 TaxID=1736327 RepID=UPI00070297DF|nr:ATP-grasp domain-containing protein [Rathayibacter sp. Leaf296]KQQ07566.1 hypothetical protein ASF46_18175 [Rathayibacter sp. Leaf296]